jgi:GNAT superfamily N-acetyltransferase
VSISITDRADADPTQLAALFGEAFGPKMTRFLMEHDEWMHRGPGGQYVATVDGAVAGYRGIIPAACSLGGVERSGVWAVNLYVRPLFRGLGLQKLLDAKVLEAGSLRMSFPGPLGAAIYAKQGYSIREDLWEWHMPLFPALYWRSRGASVRAIVRQAPAATQARLFLTRTRGFRPKRTRSMGPADLAALEDIYRRYVGDRVVTTVRDADFLNWRYLAAPYDDELAFYVTDGPTRASHYAVVRFATSPSAPARILDLFGDLQDTEGLTDILRSVIRDAACRRCSHVSILVSSPQLASAVRSCRFFPINPFRFRWSADDPQFHHDLATAGLCWTLGDSDNDLQEIAFA